MCIVAIENILKSDYKGMVICILNKLIVNVIDVFSNDHIFDVYWWLFTSIRRKNDIYNQFLQLKTVICNWKGVTTFFTYKNWLQMTFFLLVF